MKLRIKQNRSVVGHNLWLPNHVVNVYNVPGLNHDRAEQCERHMKARTNLPHIGTLEKVSVINN